MVKRNKQIDIDFNEVIYLDKLIQSGTRGITILLFLVLILALSFLSFFKWILGLLILEEVIVFIINIFKYIKWKKRITNR